MYTEIGSFDAKAKLSELLREIKKGQRFTITLRGEPVADLIPASIASKAQDVHQAIKQMRAIQKIQGISHDVIKNWMSEGRE